MIDEMTKRMAALSLRTEAMVNEYMAILITNPKDEKELTRIRDNLHTLLDARLDFCRELILRSTK
jgi:hypothetical protein